MIVVNVVIDNSVLFCKGVFFDMLLVYWCLINVRVMIRLSLKYFVCEMWGFLVFCGLKIVFFVR